MTVFDKKKRFLLKEEQYFTYICHLAGPQKDVKPWVQLSCHGSFLWDYTLQMQRNAIEDHLQSFPSNGNEL